jgi:DNA-binding GntR family transcriptional regulator
LSRDLPVNVLQQISEALGHSDSDAAGEPKYLVLYNEILRAIEAGQWPPGTRLPTEAAFATSVPASLGTIQRALRLLSDRGIIVRRHGNGTFVAGAPIQETEVRRFRFIGPDSNTPLPLYTSVLSVERTEELGPWSTFLTPDSSFVSITRLVNVNNDFRAFSRMVLAGSQFGNILEIPTADLDGMALTLFIGERFNAPTLRVTQRVSFRSLPDHVCRAIRTPAATVGLLWEMFGYGYSDAPIYYQEVYLPPNDHKLEILCAAETGAPGASGQIQR